MRIPRFVGTHFVVFGIAGLGLIGLITMGLWNVLLPAILGVPAINFWQALGLLLLSRLLFGRFGGGWGHGMRKARFVRGWNGLTPEEKERFRCAMEPRRPENAVDDEAADKS
jgi:hypothetical protein